MGNGSRLSHKEKYFTTPNKTDSHRWTMELHYLLKKNTLPLKTKQTLIGGQWKYTISQRKASRKPEKKPAV